MYIHVQACKHQIHCYACKMNLYAYRMRTYTQVDLFMCEGSVFCCLLKTTFRCISLCLYKMCLCKCWVCTYRVSSRLRFLCVCICSVCICCACVVSLCMFPGFWRMYVLCMYYLVVCVDIFYSYVLGWYVLVGYV